MTPISPPSIEPPSTEAERADPSRLWILFCSASRLIVSALLYAVGFGLLRFLWYSERVPGGYCSAPPYAAEASILYAIWCFVPFLLLSGVVEAERILLERGSGAGAGRTLGIPIEVGIALALLAGKLLPVYEGGPKQILLIAGAGYLGFLGASLQMLTSPSFTDSEQGFSPLWYAVAVVLAATFAGAMSGWLDSESSFDRLWEYRQQEWEPGELLPIDPSKSRPFVLNQSGIGDSTPTNPFKIHKNILPTSCLQVTILTVEYSSQ